MWNLDESATDFLYTRKVSNYNKLVIIFYEAGHVFRREGVQNKRMTHSIQVYKNSE